MQVWLIYGVRRMLISNNERRETLKFLLAVPQRFYEEGVLRNLS